MTLELATAGESHGPALVAIVSGLPAGLVLDKRAIDADLRRRQQGYGRSPRQQIEADEVEVLAGLRHGRTLGTPLALVVRNRDHRNWTWGMSPWRPEGEPEGKGTKPVTLPRPGHADLAGALKTQNRVISPDPEPEKGGFFRSDHFSLARFGIPAISLGGGTDLIDGGKEAGKMLRDDYLQHRYHQSTDEWNPNWDLRGPVEDLEAMYMVGDTLANSDAWPGWKAGSEFKAKRDAMMMKGK